MIKFITQKDLVCSLCEQEIPEGSFAYVHDQDDEDVNCEDCQRSYEKETN